MCPPPTCPAVPTAPSQLALALLAHPRTPSKPACETGANPLPPTLKKPATSAGALNVICIFAELVVREMEREMAAAARQQVEAAALAVRRHTGGCHRQRWQCGISTDVFAGCSPAPSCARPRVATHLRWTPTINPQPNPCPRTCTPTPPASPACSPVTVVHPGGSGSVQPGAG